MRAVEKRLRQRIKDLEFENQKLMNDRRLFREHFISRFKWWIQLLGEQSKPNINWLIEDDAKWLKRFESWYW